MSYLFDLLSIAAAIFLVLKIQQLRAILAMPLARHDFQRIDAPPADERDPVFEELERGLALLGFGAGAWLRTTRKDGEAVPCPTNVAFPSPDGGWLRATAPTSAAKPHTPCYYFVHKLADGRTAISQPFDIFFEMVQCAPLVARTASETTLGSQWRAHVDWLQGLGSEIVPVPESELVQEIADFEARLDEALIASGKARRLSEHLAAFRLRTAARILWNFGRTPKPMADTRPVPAARLAEIAIATEQASHRSPPRDVQLVLFALSAALFMVAGWLVWDPVIAVVILVVVTIHELGHFLAMRAFGYRNVHILALPLVGGVTIGQDAAPTASKRAWMSLMGPLPGILVGWALAWLLVSGRGADIPYLMPLATTFLLLNYLNILPIPPLDGAHVVEAMLPPRWARLQTIFVGVAAAAGALLAWHFEMPILVILALFQLFALKPRWQAHAAESVFPRLQMPTGRKARLQEIFRILEARAGPAVDASARVTQGMAVLHRLEAKPMGWPALLATGLVYASLLLAPVAALAYMGLLGVLSAPSADAADNEQWRVVEARRVEWRKEAKAADYRALIAGLAAVDETPPLPGPASQEAIGSAEARLQHRIPDDLRAFYEVADGVPAKQVVSIAQLRALTHQDVVNSDGVGRAIMIYPSRGGPVEIKAAEAMHWWYLGGPDSTLFYLPEPDARLPGVRVVDAWPEDPTTHATLRHYLEMLSVGDKEVAYYETVSAAREARASKRLANADVPKLMSEWREPGFMASIRGSGWPGPADSSALDAAERRIGTPLPADLRRALETHDGFPPLSLLPAAELDTLGRQTARVEAPAERIDRKAMADCIIVAAMKPPSRSGRDKLFPSLLWCPGRGEESWVAMETEKGYASFRQWLLQRTVRVAAAR